MRIAVIGLGFMGSTHARALQNVPGAQLAAVVSSDARKLGGDLSYIRGNLGESTGFLDFSKVKKYTQLSSVLEDPEIDAVDICLPSDQHFEAARAALGAGKHVLVEKPLALDGDSADWLVEEARRLGLVLMTGHVLRFIAEYRAAADVLKSRRLGEIRAACFRRRCGAPAWSTWMTDGSRSGGAVIDLLIHDIDYCLYLFGKPQLVSAVGYTNLDRGIDWIEARLGYPGIGPVIITGGWHHPKSYPFSMEFTLVSDGGTLEFRSGGETLTLYDSGGEIQKVPLQILDPFEAELRYFEDCVRNRREPELCNPRDSADAVRLARLLMDARAQCGKEIQCPF